MMKRLFLFQSLGRASFSLVLASASLFFASTHAVAQEKEQVTIKNKTLAYEVTKETTEADLKAIEKEINAAKVATFRISNIKRNNNKEIIGITTQFNDERGSSQKKSEYNSQGIRPFSIKIHENAEGYKYLEISSNHPGSAGRSSTSQTTSNSFFSTEAEGSDFNQEELMQMLQSMEESNQIQQQLMEQLIQKIKEE